MVYQALKDDPINPTALFYLTKAYFMPAGLKMLGQH